MKDKEDQRPFPSSDGKSSISNLHAADDAFTLQSGAQRQLKEERRQEIKDRIVARKEAAKESRLSAAVDTQALKTSEMKVSIKNAFARDALFTTDTSEQVLILEGPEPLYHVRPSVRHTCGQRGPRSGRATKN